MAKAVVFRCDASPQMGAGHVLRCLALAEVFVSLGRKVVFCTRASTLEIVPTLMDTVEVIVLICAPEEEAAQVGAAVPDCGIVIIDNYSVGRDFEVACHGFADLVVAFDDASGRSHDVDYLIDMGTCDPEVYRSLVSPTARLLVGPRYASLRMAFLARRKSARAERKDRQVRNVLLSFGATDPHNATSVVIEALEETSLRDVRITVALSSQAPHLEALRKRWGDRIRLVLDVQDMAFLIGDADLAIGAPGVSAFERACLGVPTILVTLADNQQANRRLFVEAGAAMDAGSLDDGLRTRLVHLISLIASDSGVRQKVGDAAAALVDGRGPRRLVSAFVGSIPIKDGGNVSVRLAEREDAAWLHELRQQSANRPSSDTSIDEQAIEAWLERMADCQDTWLLVLEREMWPVGVIRLARLTSEPVEFDVSLAIDQRWSGRGVAEAALTLARRISPTAAMETKADNASACAC